MTTLQAWMLIGLPSLALAGAMFVNHSPFRSLIGYVALLAGFGGLAYYDRVSAVVLGGVVALFYAAGRGGSVERVDTRANERGVEDAALHPARRAGTS